jgi:hypothetical protein
MSGRPWSPEENDRLRKLALAGLSLAAIAEQLKRGKSAVRVRAEKLKIAIARDRNPMQNLAAWSSSGSG